MPIYHHKCEYCDHKELDFRSMADSDKVMRCPKCQGSMFRDFKAEAAGPHLDVEFREPIEMHSIGLNHPDDIAAFRKRNPDVEVRDGVPIAHTRSEKLKILNREGYMERN